MAEDATNLFSSKGSENLLNENYATAVYNLIVGWGSASTQHRSDMLINYFSNPENLENLAASVFLAFAGKYLPSLKLPVPYIFKNTKGFKAPNMIGIFIIGRKTLSRVTNHLNHFGVAYTYRMN